MPVQIHDPLHPAAPEPRRPLYIGYLQRPTGRPVLLFDTGFLVQDDIIPNRCGWYSYEWRNVILTAVNEALAMALPAVNSLPRAVVPAHRTLLNAFLRDAGYALAGIAQPPDPTRTHFAMVDTKDLNAGDDRSFYLFRDSHFVKANDAACAPAWRTFQAMQALGPTDANGEPTTKPHATLRIGLRQFATSPAPTYIGYVQSGNQAPTLFFDTGFLVQASRNAAAVGWHAYQHPYQISANMGEGYDAGLTGYNQTPSLWDGVNRGVKAAMMEQTLARLLVAPPQAAGTREVLIDTPDLDSVSAASFYVFGGPLLRVGDPGFSAAFNAAYAGHALGALDAAGVPTQRRIVPAEAGFDAIT